MSLIVDEARMLCDEIAGELSPDGADYRGSIEIVTILVREIERLRTHVTAEHRLPPGAEFLP